MVKLFIENQLKLVERPAKASGTLQESAARGSLQYAAASDTLQDAETCGTLKPVDIRATSRSKGFG